MDDVLTPGTLVAQRRRSVGRVAYRWYEWSATCNSDDVAGAPVTHDFSPQVWWLPKPDVAIVVVIHNPHTDRILASVRE
jgi:hypothetical protein